MTKAAKSKRPTKTLAPEVASSSAGRMSRRSVLKAGIGAPFLLALSPGAPTLAGASGELNFLAVGDWGVSGSNELRSVSTAMTRHARSTGPRFVISLGDNFYPSGVWSVTDPLWTSAFEDPFCDGALMCPWYPVLGNHDYKSRPAAQIEYTAASTRWNMPSHFYRKTDVLHDGSTVELFFLDTTALASGRLSWQRLLSSHSPEQQIAWLERGLAASTSRWKIVVGHHPVFSGGPHGNTKVLVDHVRPLLEKYGVKIYINGHDHNFQHIESAGVHYFTAGNGSELKPPHRTDATRFSSQTLGFVSAKITSAALTITLVDTSGAPLYLADILYG